MLQPLAVLLRLLAGAALGAGLAIEVAILGYSLVFPPGGNKADATGLGAVLLAILAAPPGALVGAFLGLRLGRKSRRGGRGPAALDDWKVPDADHMARIISGRPDGGAPHDPAQERS